MTQAESKPGKKKELNQAQLKAVASDVVLALGESDRPELIAQFTSLPPSERRKVLEFMGELPNVKAEKILWLSRAALNGGLAKRHEATLKAVVQFCTRAGRANPATGDTVGQILVDLMEPARLTGQFELPNLADLDAEEIATFPSINDSLCKLLSTREHATFLRERAGQWSRLLGAILIDRSASQVFGSSMAQNVLSLIKPIPLKQQPVELRLAAGWLERLSEGQDKRIGGTQENGDPRVHVETEEQDSAVSAAPASKRDSYSITLGQAFDQIRGIVEGMRSDSSNNKVALERTVTSLQSELRLEKESVVELQSRLHSATGDLEHVRRRSTEVHAELEHVEGELKKVVQERDTARREIELVQGMTQTTVDAARAGVRKDFMKLVLLPMRSIRDFAERLKKGTAGENPDLLAVPLSTVIQVLHKQGFATDAELPRI